MVMLPAWSVIQKNQKVASLHVACTTRCIPCWHSLKPYNANKALLANETPKRVNLDLMLHTRFQIRLASSARA